MATLATLTGHQLPPDSAEDSHDLLPWLKGETPKPPRDTMVHNTNAKHYAIRHGEWVLIDSKSGYTGQVAPPKWNAKHQQPADDAEPAELYQIREDPGQRTNLAAKHPEKVVEMRTLLKKIRDQGHSAPRLETP
jgi:arylsulfatase A